MLFKGSVPSALSRTINRFGHSFFSDKEGNLEIDIDNLKKKVTEIDAEGAEFTSKESISEDEKAELVSALKAYGFSEVKAEKTK